MLIMLIINFGKALHFEKGHKIWTCDFELIKGLKEMGYDICVTTKDLKTKHYKKITD